MYTPKDYKGIIPLNAIVNKGDDGLYCFIKANKAKCNKCGDIIESKFQHDFVQCSCGNTFVDGGLTYVRIGFEPAVGYEDLCEYGEASEEDYTEWKHAHELLKPYKEKLKYEQMKSLESLEKY